MGMMTGCKTKKPVDTLTTDLDSSDSAMSDTSGDGLPRWNWKNLFEPGSKYGLQTVRFDYDNSRCALMPWRRCATTPTRSSRSPA